MDYKLAKKLKEAGFPQINRNEIMEHRLVMEEQEDGTIEKVCIPTLQELIGACGEEFIMLVKDRYKEGYWWCRAERKDKEMSAEYTIRDKTPRVAVAKLWLKLNKNKTV